MATSGSDNNPVGDRDHVLLAFHGDALLFFFLFREFKASTASSQQLPHVQESTLQRLVDFFVVIVFGIF